MLELNGSATALAALAVGFSSSFHCFAMCGPLACAAGESSRASTIAAYQGARIASYAVVGALLGLLGESVGEVLRLKLAPIAPWLLAATLLAAALDLGRRLSPLPGISAVVRRVGLFAQRLPATARALALGGLTPLLPCGLLYGVFAAAAAAGSTSRGASLMAAFGFGALPALLAAQVGGQKLMQAGGRRALIARRAVPALAALVLVYRTFAVAEGQCGCH